MPSLDDDFGSGILEQVAGIADTDEGPVSAAPAAPTQEKPASPEDQFAALDELFADGDETAVEGTVAPEAAPAAGQPAAPAAPMYSQEHIARAAAIGIQPGEFLQWPTDQVEGRLAAAEQFRAFQMHYSQQAEAQRQQAEAQQAAQPQAPPEFDEAAIRKQLSEKYEEAMVDDLVESKRALHEAKLARLENERLSAVIAQQQVARQQQEAARAFNDWNSAIQSAVPKLDPSIQEVAKAPDRLKAIQQRTMELGAMYTAAGRPIPSAEQLAKDAAFALFGDEIVAAAKGKRGGPMPQERFSGGVTARVRPTVAPANEGVGAAIAGIESTALYRKLNGLMN